MNDLKQSFNQLPVEDSVVIRVTEPSACSNNGNTIFDWSRHPFTSTKQVFDDIKTALLAGFRPPQLYTDGLKAEIMEPGKAWVKGKFRLRIVLEFIPDETEENKLIGNSASSLDDFRKMNL